MINAGYWKWTEWSPPSVGGCHAERSDWRCVCASVKDKARRGLTGGGDPAAASQCGALDAGSARRRAVGSLPVIGRQSGRRKRTRSGTVVAVWRATAYAGAVPTGAGVAEVNLLALLASVRRGMTSRRLRIFGWPERARNVLEQLFSDGRCNRVMLYRIKINLSEGGRHGGRPA